MVKYGSTVRIAVLPRDSNIPLYVVPVTLADTYTAHDAMKNGTEKVKAWLYTQATLQKKYSDITDEQIVEIAKARGLIIDSPKPVADLFYFSSLSGKTKGHYIERSSNTISCTCPGFKNRGYCWASTKVLSNAAFQNKWAGTADLFYSYRMREYGE